eukprot:111053_1
MCTFFIYTIVFLIIYTKGMFLNWNISYRFNDTIMVGGVSLYQDDSIWICGGFLLNSCYHFHISLDSGWIQLSKKQVELTTPLISYKQISPSFYSESTNEGAYNIHTNQGCFIGLDVISKSYSQCMCCSMNDNDMTMHCDDISQINNECLDRSQSCVVYDKYNNNLIQIGGVYNDIIYDDIHCFDTNTQTFISDSNKLQTQCKFGKYKLDTLYGGNFMSGCSMVSETILIIVGGNYDDHMYSKQIQICDTNESINGCYISHNSLLDEGILSPKVIRMSNCIVLIIGGVTKSGNSNRIYKYNVCTDIIEHRDILPIEYGISLFNVYVGNGFICIFGGVTGDDKYVKHMYCSVLSIDNEDYMYVSNIPSGMPTVSPIDISMDMIHMNDWKYFDYKYKTAISAQICATDNEYAYFFGGIEWSKNNKQYAQETTEFMAISNDGNVIEYNMYEYNDQYDNMPMLKIACSHQCSAYWQYKIYIVMPNNKAVFYECIIDNENKQVKCKDLCNGNGLNDAHCNSLGYEGCVTSYGNVLFIIGGGIGNTRKQSILIYNMETNKWINDYELYYGKLPIGLIGSTCATYDDNIYIFGGFSDNNQIRNIIYKCSIRNGCIVLNNKLETPRYMSQTSVVGKNIIIGCGTDENNHPISTIEIFDAMEHTISISEELVQGRKYCCMINSNTGGKNSILISGGDIMNEKGNIIGSNSILQNTYTLMNDVISHDENENDIYNYNELIGCKQYRVVSNDGTFNGIFYNKGETNGYYIWKDNINYIILYKPNEECWIGGNNIWAINSNKPYLIIGDSNEWFITYSDTNSKYINIKINCVDEYESIEKFNDENNDETFMFGFSKLVFIVVSISVSIILLIIIFMIIICCHQCKENRKIKRRNNALERISDSVKTNVITPSVLFSDPKSSPFLKAVNIVTNVMGYYGDSSDTEIGNLSDE